MKGFFSEARIISGKSVVVEAAKSVKKKPDPLLQLLKFKNP